jgi:glycosyltransferase involved in cell wall biosynthesis
LKLSIIMPVYNERDTLEEIVRQVLDTGLVHEIVMVDDGSTDGSREIMKQWEDDDTVRVILQEKNRGKGSAVRAGFEAATGDIYLIQDADLEYDPRDYKDLIRPIEENRADVVYGSRFMGKPARKMYFWHRLGNFLLTMLTNVLYNLDLSDMETCYKAFRADVVRDIPLHARRFEFEPEITAKVAKRGCRLVEVGISYYGREFDQGKKITGWDAIPAMWTLIKYRFVD